MLPAWDYSALGPGRMTGTAQSVGGRVGEDDVSEMFGVVPPHWWLSSERHFGSFLKVKRLRGKRMIIFKRVEGGCGKGIICFLCLLGIGLKLQSERFNSGTRENLLTAGIVKSPDSISKGFLEEGGFDGFVSG